MQIIAMITMLIDHIGIVFYPDEEFWRIVGRLALPLYAYGIVQGYRHSKNLTKYASRLMVIAMISQVPYMLALHTMTVNVVGTLLVSLIALIALDRFKVVGRCIVIIAGVLMLELLPFDYNSYVLGLVLIFRYYQKSWHAVLLHCLLNITFIVALPLQIFSILSTLLLTYRPREYQLINRIVVPRWVWRSFYPGHLIIIAVVRLSL